MNSDSESQDSDDGRRFRFESTRKDTATSLAPVRRKVSPPRRRRYSRSRSRSPSRDRSSRHSKDERRSRSSIDREANSKKDKSKDKDKKRHHKDSHRPKDSDKHKNKHKKRSRERSRERNNCNEENSRRKEEPTAETNDRKPEKRRDDETPKRKEESIVTANDRKSEKRRDDETPKRKEESIVPVKSEKPRDEESTTITNQRKSEKPRDDSETNGSRKRKDADKVTERVATEKTREELNALVVSDEMRADAAVPARKRPKSFFERVVNKKAAEEDPSVYGPALPPKLEKKLLNVRERQEERAKDQTLAIGPAMPQHLLATKEDDDEKVEDVAGVSKEDEEEDSFGPTLPPQLQKRKVVGPVLPANFVPGEIPTDVPSMSPTAENVDSDDDDDVVGPLPPDHPAAQSQAQKLLEYRALQMQAKFRDKTSPDKNKREEWMIELPPAQAVAIGLGMIPRTFRPTAGPDMSDRSMWTDTPADRLKRQREKEENRFVASKESSKKKPKDEEGASKKEPEEEKRPESLLDMHLKTLKKKKKKMEKEAKELGLPTRRPFDRDVDLQANRLDEARKKKIFDKASRLNDRFSTAKML